MKKLFLSMMLVMAAFMSANAMSFERAQAEALYLTDKMAYELNLNDQQYNDAYEINLDYFLRVDSPSDLYGSYYSYRLDDLRCILYDWQYSLLAAADYFLRPVVWRAGGWHFPIYSYYNRGYYYYSRPVVWRTYRGGHSRYYHHAGFYADRRPHWNGGLRGHDMRHHSHSYQHSSPSVHRHAGEGYRSSHGNYRPGGSSSHGSMNPGGHYSGRHDSHGGGMNRGNSFDGSSSRMSGGSYGSHGSSTSRSYSSNGSRSSSSMGGSRGGSMSHGGSMGGSRGASGGGVSRSGRR